MPNCFQLLRGGVAVSLANVDEEMCRHFEVPCDPVHYFEMWYDVIGGLLSAGGSWVEVRAICAEDYADRPILARIADWLEANFEARSWLLLTRSLPRITRHADDSSARKENRMTTNKKPGSGSIHLEDLHRKLASVDPDREVTTSAANLRAILERLLEMSRVADRAIRMWRVRSGGDGRLRSTDADEIRQADLFLLESAVIRGEGLDDFVALGDDSGGSSPDSSRRGERQSEDLARRRIRIVGQDGREISSVEQWSRLLDHLLRPIGDRKSTQIEFRSDDEQLRVWATWRYSRNDPRSAQKGGPLLFPEDVRLAIQEYLSEHPDREICRLWLRSLDCGSVLEAGVLLRAWALRVERTPCLTRETTTGAASIQPGT